MSITEKKILVDGVKALVRYKELIRFEKELVEYLSGTFLPELSEKRGGALTLQQKLEIFLRYHPTWVFSQQWVKILGVHQSIVSKTLNSVLDRINEKAYDQITFPQTQGRLNEAKQQIQFTYSYIKEEEKTCKLRNLVWEMM